MRDGQSSCDKPTVVIIDDDMALRVLARESLEQFGFVVDEAADGQQGLAVIESTLPEIVLLDVMMPVLDGYALCTQLRRHPKFMHLPVVMITGLADVESIEHAFEVKPVCRLNTSSMPKPSKVYARWSQPVAALRSSTPLRSMSRECMD